MNKFRFLHLSALTTLALALGLSALPAQAQDDGRKGFRDRGNAERTVRQSDRPRQERRSARSEARSNGGEARPVATARQAPQSRGDWNGGRRGRSESPAGRYEGRAGRREAPAAAVAPPTRNARYGADRNATYTAPRDRSYGATTRGNRSSQQQRGAQGWSGSNDRRDGARRADWQRDRRDDARRVERRDDRSNYRNGYRDGRRDDNRYGNNHRRWDNRGWRNDNRYDWHRYRAANRNIYRLGRYYSPYRNYSYSRINIGFRLGSLFYSNRYWINDPWQYRLPAAYGPYRWVRYYDDALLVDIYSGEVVDVINNFFW